MANSHDPAVPPATAEQFRAMFENSLDGLLLTEPDGSVLAANPAACAILRRTEAEIRAAGRAGIVDPRDERLRAAVEERQRTGRWRGELTFVRPGGERFPVELSSAAFTQPDGQQRTCIVFRDVSESRRVEALLRTAQRAAVAGLWDWEMASGELHWSTQLYEMFGLDPTTPATFEAWRSVLHPDDVALADTRITEAVRAGTPLVSEYRIVRPAGDVRWIEARGDTFYDGSGAPLRMSGICIDVTERKQAQQLVDEAEARRRATYELLENLARLVPGVIYQYRLYPDGRSAFPYSSPGMQDIYEVTPDEVREDATPVFGRLHPEDAAAVSEAIAQSARTLETFYSEFRVVLPRQGLRWRWSQAHPVRTADGGTLWHGIILDVTDRKRAEEEKSSLEAQLQQAQKMESVGRLAGGVAHDFNNMLGVILGHADLALEQVDPSTPIHDDLEEIRKAATRSADLTRQLLAFARRQAVVPKVLDLNVTIAGMVTMLQRLIGEDVHLDWTPTPGLWPVKIDPSQVDQVLANLCVNARDAIAGVGRVAIRLENVTFQAEAAAGRGAGSAGDYVRIAVQDDGCGMDEDTLAHVFEPFFTTKPTGKGTGLGLATVYGVAKQNKGFVTAESTVGRGTTMAVYLPKAQRPLEEETALPARAAGGTETILIVEDEPGLLTMAVIVLERLGYTVLPARSAAEALRIVGQRAADIDLLVTDVIMPAMNGRDLVAQVRAQHPRVKPLFMSGYPADVIARGGVLDEGIAFVQKPFSKDALARTVRAALDGPGPSRA